MFKRKKTETIIKEVVKENETVSFKVLTKGYAIENAWKIKKIFKKIEEMELETDTFNILLFSKRGDDDFIKKLMSAYETEQQINFLNKQLDVLVKRIKELDESHYKTVKILVENKKEFLKGRYKVAGEFYVEKGELDV